MIMEEEKKVIYKTRTVGQIKEILKYEKKSHNIKKQIREKISRSWFKRLTISEYIHEQVKKILSVFFKLNKKYFCGI